MMRAWESDDPADWPKPPPDPDGHRVWLLVVLAVTRPRPAVELTS